MEGIEIRKALEEAKRLVGARLAKAFQVGDTLFVRFYDPPGALVFDPKKKVFHLTELRPPVPPSPPPLAQLLRTLSGQKLLGLDQAGWDRVVRLRFPAADVVVDFRPRAGEVFFFGCDGRTFAPYGGTYEPAEFGEGHPRGGVGPQLRKAIQASLGRKPTEEELAAWAQEMAARPPQGYLYFNPQGPVASFFPRPDLGPPQATFPAFWQALDRVLQTELDRAWSGEHEHRLKQAIQRRKRALEALNAGEREAEAWGEVKNLADLIMARLKEIPSRAREAVVEGFDGQPVKIQLDPMKTPLAYAQELYRKASKLRRRLEHIPQRRSRLLAELSELEQQLNQLQEKPELAPYLQGVWEEEPQARPTQVRERPPGREWIVEGFRVVVGRSAQENDVLLRRAGRDDLWLHARDVPGAHVIIRRGGRPVPEEVLRRAAEFAAWFSRARGELKVPVSYTEVRYVKKPRGAPPGTVTLVHEHVIVVSGKEEP